MQVNAAKIYLLNTCRVMGDSPLKVILGRRGTSSAQSVKVLEPIFEATKPTKIQLPTT